MTGDFCVSEDEYNEEYGLGSRIEPEEVKPIRKAPKKIGMRFKK